MSESGSVFRKSVPVEPDFELFSADEEFHGDRLWLVLREEPKLVALKSLQSHEQKSADIIRRRAKRTHDISLSRDIWLDKLILEFGEVKNKREEEAQKEKVDALHTLMTRKLSILTGGAGTGKTSVLHVFLDTLEELEGKEPVLLLAPTGKARVRLSTKTKRNTMTIHQFLLKAKWFMQDTFILKSSSLSRGIRQLQLSLMNAR